MNKSKLMYYFYLMIWVMYYLQGTLYASGSSISQAFLAVALLLSGYYIVKVNNKKSTKFGQSKYITALNLLLVLVTVYGVILFLSGDKSGSQWYIYLKEYYYSILPIYAFYYYSKRNIIQQKELIFFAFVFLTVTIVFFFKQYYEVSENLNIEEVTNNSGYMFIPLLALLPMLSIKPIYKYLIMVVLAAFVLFSAKRGAIIIFIICALEFLFFQVKDSSKRTKLWTLIISVSVLIAGYYYSVKIINDNPYLSSRFDATLEGNSSSRDIIYSKLINHIKNESNPLRFLFGYGVNGTRNIADRLAHNDWLEIAIDMGLIGFVIYLFYWHRFFLTRKYIKKETGILHSLYIIMTFLFIRSFFSMSINDMYIVTTFIIGYIVAQADINKIQQIKNPNSRIIKIKEIK